MSLLALHVCSQVVIGLGTDSLQGEEALGPAMVPTGSVSSSAVTTVFGILSPLFFLPIYRGRRQKRPVTSPQYSVSYLVATLAYEVFGSPASFKASFSGTWLILWTDRKTNCRNVCCAYIALIWCNFPFTRLCVRQRAGKGIVVEEEEEDGGEEDEEIDFDEEDFEDDEGEWFQEVIDSFVWKTSVSCTTSASIAPLH